MSGAIGSALCDIDLTYHENACNDMILENLIKYFFVIDIESVTKLNVLGRLLGK